MLTRRYLLLMVVSTRVTLYSTFLPFYAYPFIISISSNFFIPYKVILCRGPSPNYCPLRQMVSACIVHS